MSFSRTLASAFGIIIVLFSLLPLAGAQQLYYLDRERFEQMLGTVGDDILKHYYDPNFHGVDFKAQLAAAKQRIDKATTNNMALSSIAEALDSLNDSHTFFVPPPHTVRQEYGWQYQMVGNRCFVTRVRPKSDADAKGMKPGDEVLTINGFAPTRDTVWKMQYFFGVLQPQPGFHLNLQDPTGNKRVLNVAAKVRETKRVLDLTGGGAGNDIWELLRQEENEEHLMRARYAESGDALLVLKVPEFVFSDVAVREMMDKARKHNALILDLRGNPGGSVDTLGYLAGDMFDKDVKIADRVGRKESKPLIAKGSHHPFTGKLVVLVDSKSASAYNEYVFFAGRRVGSRNGTGAIFYWFADQLGTARSITTGSGTGQTPGQLCYDADFTPYGQEMSHSEHLQTTACPPNYKFTGYERDTETGLDYAFARYYSSRLGRFLSVDRLRGSIGSLQSHNAYAYVVNNPLKFIDRLGLQLGYTCVQDPTGELGGCGGGGGGGGGGANCPPEFSDCSGYYMDGIQMPASTVQMWLGLGWAVPCPNGQCDGVPIGGVLAYFSAYLTGSTYAPYAGPGSIFDTNNQAMIAGAMYAENQSLLNDGNEQCGMTYSAGGQFSYTGPQHGDWDGCGAPQILAAMAAVPAGDLTTGGYHSHGEFDPRYANERFSGQPGDTDPGDIGWSAGFGIPVSVATPGQHVIIYYPEPGCQTFFLGGPEGTGTTTPICL